MAAHHGHHHDHEAGHGHDHAPKHFGTAFAIGIVLNVAFVLVEAGYGFWGNSMALLADAGHNLSDVLGLAVAWIAAILGARPPTRRFTYGLRNSSILAALFNALVLLVAVGGIATEAVRRLVHPQPVAGTIVIVVAAIGILINGVTAAMFASGRKGDLNIRGAYLHMMADAAVSLGVVAAGVIIAYTHAQWIDPVVSLFIAVVIFLGTWGLLKDSLSMSMAAVPPGIKADDVRAALTAMPGVAAVHDLHIWPMGTTETAMTCHLLMPAGFPGADFLRQAEHKMEHDFGIRHTTFQIETERERACRLSTEDAV